MRQRLSRTALAVAMASTLAAGPLARPAVASEGSTWTIIGAAAALIGGIVLYNNYEHKRQAANSIVGYTRNGGTVYGDGRIVMPNGATIYPNSRGQYPWGQSAYYEPYATGYLYDPDRSGRYRVRNNDDDDRDGSAYRVNRGRAYGHYKHHKHDREGDRD